MTVARSLHSAVLLPTGKVLAIGGIRGIEINDSDYLDTAELFDPATNAWSETSGLNGTRAKFRAVLLLSGQVLAIGGVSAHDGPANNFLDTAERYDLGLGFAEEMRPSVSRVSLTNGVFTLAGVRFQSASEGASGNSQSSAGNFPMVMLRDADSGQTRLLTPGANGWSNNGFTAQALTNPPAGYSLLTVVTNGVPGPAQAFSANAGAASTINLSGRVSNPNNTGFRATMTLRSSIGEVRTTQTNANGEYSFSALPAAPPPTATPTPTPTPTTARLLSMTPHARQVNSGAFTIQVTGSGFTTSSVVQWNGQNRLTTFNSATSLSATIQAGDVISLGNPTVTVTNGGASSNGLCFTVTPNLVETYGISSLSQSSASAGTNGLTLTINATVFLLANDVARWNGSSRATSIIDPSLGRISITLTAADLANPGTGSITLIRFISPSTLVSNALCFTITPNTATLLSNAALAPEQQGVTYTVTPSGTLPDGTAATFTPPSRTFSSLNGDVTNGNFFVNSVFRSLSVLAITPTNAPLPQVTIKIEFRDNNDIYQLYDDPPKTTNNAGRYDKNLETGVAYRITAQRAGYVFSFPSAADAEYLDIPNLMMDNAVQCIGRLAISPPDAITTAATGVTTTTATLNGTVNPNGADTSYYFEWGTETTLAGANRTNTRNAGAGSSAQAVSETINGLALGQTYYFRLVATNGGGVNQGTTLSFMMPALCPTISGLTPNTAAIGETIAINGTNLDGVTSIRFAGNVSAIFTRGGDTKIFVTVPVGAGNGPITLSKPGCADVPSPAFLPATACEAGVELRVDDGTSETSVGFGDGFETAYFANRLTPTTYPATLQNVSLRLLGFPAGYPITILAAANPGGTNNINGLTLQRVASVVRTEELESHPVAPLTITTGDFVVGVLFNNPPGLFPIASDINSTQQKRSYFSLNGESFILLDEHNFFIRAQLQQPSQNCGADLSLTKTHTGNFIPGNNGSYTLTVRNGGPGTTAGTITLTDTLPAGLSFISSAGSGWNFAVAG
ncbi:MAG TPA: kelch repeat-containing protein, partial [Blastocatellia bacterium]